MRLDIDLTHLSILHIGRGEGTGIVHKISLTGYAEAKSVLTVLDRLPRAATPRVLEFSCINTIEKKRGESTQYFL